MAKNYVGNIVAIVGRPNVGKSTLFNRLVGGRQAIVDEHSGVTRDRHYGTTDWQGKDFSVIDTGGYAQGTEDVFETEIRKQALLAIEEAEVVLFMVDVSTGITNLDNVLAKRLRKTEKPVILVVNKVDNNQRLSDMAEFYKLGFKNMFGVSSVSGSGTGELLDEVVKNFASANLEKDSEETLPKIAIVGRPNVGKSSITNILLGNERNIVTAVPGTTRDAILERYKSFGFNFYLIDTAGLRKKAKVTEDLEFYSTLRSVRAIESADVCMLMIDATVGFESQDVNIFRLIEKNNKGAVILINKWDLYTKDTSATKRYTNYVKQKIMPFSDVPIIFTSVKEKQRIHKALETATNIYKNRTQRIKTRQLNDFLLPIIKNTPPPAYKGKYIKIKYITQLPKHYPLFVFFCNLPQYIREPYRRFLENQLRQKFNFSGVPIKIYFRKK